MQTAAEWLRGKCRGSVWKSYCFCTNKGQRSPFGNCHWKVKIYIHDNSATEGDPMVSSKVLFCVGGKESCVGMTAQYGDMALLTENALRRVFRVGAYGD